MQTGHVKGKTTYLASIDGPNTVQNSLDAFGFGGVDGQHYIPPIDYYGEAMRQSNSGDKLLTGGFGGITIHKECSEHKCKMKAFYPPPPTASRELLCRSLPLSVHHEARPLCSLCSGLGLYPGVDWLLRVRYRRRPRVL